MFKILIWRAQTLDLQLLFLTSLFFMGVGAFCVELQHLQIQGCHFLKSALNLDLTRSNARASGTFFDQFFFHGCTCFLRRVTAPANPRMSLFEKCFKSWFDTVRWWEMSCAFEIFRNYWFRCFLRRVMVILRQQKNFGPNVIYFVSGTLVIVARLTYSWPKSDFWTLRTMDAKKKRALTHN